MLSNHQSGIALVVVVASTLFSCSIAIPSEGSLSFEGDNLSGIASGWHEITLDTTKLRREKRSADDANNHDGANNSEVDPMKRVTKVELHDNHTTLIVHWAGRGSDVILALAKDAGETSSALYVSRNYGKNFTNVMSSLRTNGGGVARLHKYYNVNDFNSMYIFTDIQHGCIFTTSNFGGTFTSHCDLPFTPRTLKMNPKNPQMILGMDEQDPMSNLYMSKDFGVTWSTVVSHVKTFHWGVPPHDAASTIYIHKVQGGDKGELLKVMDRYVIPDILLTDVTSFEIRDEYIFAVKSVHLLGSHNPNHAPTLQLWVSYNREDFNMAQFPLNYFVTDFYVADASEGQVMVCVSHNSSFTNLYISEARGLKFSLSLEKIVFFNPKTANPHNLLRIYTNETFADITKISGVDGIYIASQQTSDMLHVDKQRSLITFDKGAQWQPIPAPEIVMGQTTEDCSKTNNCSLHLTQEFHKLYPGTQSSSILSLKSAPGLVVASGVLGDSLKADTDVFVSTNAGVSWRQVLKGNYFYALGDHGGLIVAVHQFEPTNHLIYSTNEGLTWQTYRFMSEKIRVYGLLTEPGEKTTIFSLFGSGLDAHSWIVLQIDFFNEFNGKKCAESDYKMWSVSEALPNNVGCLLGHVTEFQRRIADVKCYNGKDFVRTVQTKNCSCTREDFECDYGYKETTFNGSCQFDTAFTHSALHPVPTPCYPGDLYPYTRGYRKVAGDTCKGGAAQWLGPLQYSCPIPERAEFLVLSKLNRILRLDLASEQLTNLVDMEERVQHVAFDYKENCLIYVTGRETLQRRCFNLTVESQYGPHWEHPLRQGGSVSGLAFEWTGRILYLTYADLNLIRVVHVGGDFERTLMTRLNQVYKPGHIVVDPHHGYLFFVGATSADSSDFAIYRAVLDGSSERLDQVANSSLVSQNTVMTIDLETERLYWVDQSQGRLCASGIWGENPKVLRTDNHLQRVSGIGVYGNDLYVSNQGYSNVLRTNKNEPDRWETVASGTDYVVTMHLVSNVSQHAVSACNEFHTRCSQLCFPRPWNPNSDKAGSHNQSRTCLCGEGYHRVHSPKPNPTGSAPKDEQCMCEGNEVMAANGTCFLAANGTSCAEDKIKCSNGRCIMKTWKCDGEDDCGDSSDELDCPLTHCSDESFTCKNGKCIPKHWVCDREDDCRDGDATDEKHCNNTQCESFQFKCANGYCIDARWKCDLDDDCHDHSDEDNCGNTTVCHSFAFTCASDGVCLDPAKECDGTFDCADHSDEAHCENGTHTGGGGCAPYQFACASGNQCILSFWVCDGDNDCNDHSDEEGCNATTSIPSTTTTSNIFVCDSSHFKCTNNFCVNWQDHCNGIDDCGDGSDEALCEFRTSTTLSPCPVNQRACGRGTPCLPLYLFCNGRPDCPDGSDEENCEICRYDQFLCASNGACIPQAWECNGRRDCVNGEDEQFCNSTTSHPATDEVSCIDNSGNIPRSKLCDKQVDCHDGSDELDCNYSGDVDCSKFNDHKHVCCSIEQCGVYVDVLRSFWDLFRETGDCSASLSASSHRGNKCSGHSTHYKCSDSQFTCGDHKKTCLAPVQHCDGHPDCENGKDEDDCQDCDFSVVDPVFYSQPSITNNSVQFDLPANTTKLAFATLESNKGLSQLAWRPLNVTKHPMKVSGLHPATSYRFSFYKGKCVVYSTTVITSDGVSSPPTHLKVRPMLSFEEMVFGASVFWRMPENPNGRITGFVVSHQLVSQNGTAQDDVWHDHFDMSIVRTNGLDFKALVTHHIDLDGTYEFWVTAVNSMGQGQATDKVTVTITDVTRSTDLKVMAKSVSDTSVTLTWKADQSAAGYIATLYMYNSRHEIKKELDNKTTSYVFADLCPGTTVQVGVEAKYGNHITGRMYHPQTKTGQGMVTLKGATPQVDIVSVNMTGSTSVMVYYKARKNPVNPPYYLAYSTQGRDGSLVNATTVTSSDPSSHQLSGLLACETYFLGVRAGHMACPLSDTKTIITKEDILAAPKDVIAHRPQLKDGHYSMTLSWHSPCAHSERKLKYIITVHRRETSYEVLTGTSTDNFSVNYTFDELYTEETYSFTVRVNVAGAQESETVSTRIPALYGPQLHIIPGNGDSLIVAWAWKGPKNKDDFKEYVLTVTDLKSSFMWTNHTSGTRLQLKHLPSHRDLVFRVEAMAKAGHVLAESEKMEYAFYPEAESNNGAATDNSNPAISQTKLVAIMVPVSVVVVLLAAGLVVFIVRHKRLQRSFLAFANSHYNIQSGTTTFSDDLDGDEPMIQGFSDDEPLVLA